MYEVLPCFRSWSNDFDLKEIQACDKKNLQRSLSDCVVVSAHSYAFDWLCIINHKFEFLQFLIRNVINFFTKRHVTFSSSFSSSSLNVMDKTSEQHAITSQRHPSSISNCISASVMAQMGLPAAPVRTVAQRVWRNLSPRNQKFSSKGSIIGDVYEIS